MSSSISPPVGHPFRHEKTETWKDKLRAIPTFEKNEVVLGEFLGNGGFADVFEVRAFDMETSNGNDGENVFSRSSRTAIGDIANRNTCKKSILTREFIANNCVRQSGGAKFVIKRLKKSVMDDSMNQQKGLASLTCEAQLLSTLRHPSIIQPCAKVAGTDSALNDTPTEFSLVLDRLDETLHSRMSKWREQKKKLKVRPGRALVFSSRLLAERRAEKRSLLYERLSAACDLSAAIKYLHQKGILHRDVKPGNIGFGTQGEIKLFDFGSARRLPDKEKTAAVCENCYNLTQLVGSLRYMAPEVALKEPYNSACDIYSFCLVFWEMIALERPYEHITSEKAFHKAVFHERRRPQLRKSWSPILKTLFVGGWKHDVQSRLTAAEVQEMLFSEILRQRNYDIHESCLENDNECYQSSPIVFYQGRLRPASALEDLLEPLNSSRHSYYCSLAKMTSSS